MVGHITDYFFRYHSASDDRLPETYVCFECRLRSHPKFAALKAIGSDTVVMQAHQLLAIFRFVPCIHVDSPHICSRRGIKIAENTEAETIQEFRLHSSMCPIAVFGLLMLLTPRPRT
jgi:hypothetical protein